MNFTSSQEWRILPIGNRDVGPPKLLFKFITSSDGFKLYITDLIRCWKDSRDRASIAKEAARSGTSIDPSEDASQLNVLLSKLRDGLMGINGGRCKIGSMSDDDQEGMSCRGFRLLSRTPLPEPFPPLLWTFRLSPERRRSLTRELLLPALASQLKYRLQVEELRNRIDEKDHVITRLMDKIEQSSIDLSMVFPGYSTGRKGLSAQNAVKVVPGLSRFDGGGWEKAHADEQLATTQSLVDAISKPGAHQLSFEGPRDSYGEAAGWELFGTAGDWHEDWIDPRHHDPTFTDDDDEYNNIELHGALSVPELQIEESTSAFEDLSQANNSTDDRSTAPLPPKIPPSTNRRAYSTSPADSSPRPPRPKIGSIGNLGPGRSKTSQISIAPLASDGASTTSSQSDSESPRLPKKPKMSSKLDTLGGKEKTSQAAAFAQSGSPPLLASKHPPQSRKLGTLGGQKPPVVQSTSLIPPHRQNETPTALHTPPRKLGVLGGHQKSSTQEKAGTTSQPAPQHSSRHGDLDATDSLSPSPSPAVASPSNTPTHRKEPVVKSPVEPEDEPATAEEIADRKREELKRTLNVSGGNKKKKRKF